ncbi:hypothetical protein CO731_01122 [Aminobacter sp. MSH1]|uniref:hypothetical protein n=1 Tax=Aminobacter sp. MSH1 TaxID=374606 RepID=UPI000D3DA3B0|nr:hypothetical protein [Aminobacter sp. MSH1]AWC21670.1 hypothetical protein CO731_01122 [Aminobacter sp. MSH1]
MQGDAIQLQQAVEGCAKEPAVRQRSFLANFLLGAIALFSSVRSRTYPGEQADGLDALDMLGGWQGSDAQRRKR